MSSHMPADATFGKRHSRRCLKKSRKAPIAPISQTQLRYQAPRSDAGDVAAHSRVYFRTMEENHKSHRTRMEALYRKLLPYSFVFFALSLTLCLWNTHAIRKGIAPDHLLPFVKAISGTQECIPTANQWTLYLIAISIMSTSISGGALLGFCAFLIWKRFFS